MPVRGVGKNRFYEQAFLFCSFAGFIGSLYGDFGGFGDSGCLFALFEWLFAPLLVLFALSHRLFAPYGFASRLN